MVNMEKRPKGRGFSLSQEIVQKARPVLEGPHAEALRRGTRIDRLLRWLLFVCTLLLALVFWAVGLMWLFVIAMLVAGWVLWDRWQAREDTRV